MVLASELHPRSKGNGGQTRRGFLGLIGAALAGAAIDPERELWIPGKVEISIPSPKIWLASRRIDGWTFTTAGSDWILVHGEYWKILKNIQEARGEHMIVSQTPLEKCPKDRMPPGPYDLQYQIAMR